MKDFDDKPKSFDERPKDFAPKRGLKTLPGQKSMFDGKPKPPTQQEFEQQVQQQVQQAQERKTNYQSTAAELYAQFMKAIADSTLAENRNIFSVEAEKELLGKMVEFARLANADPEEQECEGSLTLIVLLCKACLLQRDKINDLGCALDKLQKKFNLSNITDYINKEIAKALDKQKDNG
jgi:hypothetical protein